jgi:iron complex transport system substrate-binding protein
MVDLFSVRMWHQSTNCLCEEKGDEVALQKADDCLHLYSPPPNLPRQGGGALSSLPWLEGLREGDKKTYSFKRIIDTGVFYICILSILLGLAATPSGAAVFGMAAEDVIIDQAGRKIVVKDPYNRIISLYGAHTENLFELGLDREIIGVSRHEDYPPQALKKPVFSYRDDPEKFLAARPDLVLIRPMIDRGYPQFVERLEKSGITVASLQPGTVDEMYTYWQILGILTGKPDRASKMVDNFQKAVLQFNTLTASIVSRKKVYFEAIHSKMKTFSPNSMAIFALETAGGINIAADAIPVRKTNIAYYGKERILSRAMEIDVYLAQSGTMNQPSISLIKNEAGYQVIKAVDQNQIYIVDERLISRPTYRLLDGITEIGRILYPEVFGNKAQTIITQAKRF